MSEPRTLDDDLQTIARCLLLGVVPERQQELHDLWEKYQPHFDIRPDSGRDGMLVMEAGMFKFVRFNHRLLRVFWLLSYAAWEGYVAFQEASCSKAGVMKLQRLREILRCVDAVCEIDEPGRVNFPQGIPQPGMHADADITARAVGDFAVFAAGWAFLHEVRHVIHQQDGTSSSHATDHEERRKEEISCDNFATRFLLDTCAAYAASHAVSLAKLSMKRQIGVYFALFAITVLARQNWADTDSHPSIQRRIDSVLAAMEETGFSKGAAIIAATAFAALKAIYPDAPTPMKTVAAKAVAEGWTPASLDEILGPMSEQLLR